MIPSSATLINTAFTFTEQPTNTYRMDLLDQFKQKHIRGYCDGQRAMEQAIYKIINTERYKYIIYSWNYGIELVDLYGQPVSYVCPELERRITEALLQDTRITSVTDFVFSVPKKGVVHVSFTAHTIFGDVQAERMIEGV